MRNALESPRTAVQYAFSLEPMNMTSEPFAPVLEPLEALTGPEKAISSPYFSRPRFSTDFLAVSNLAGKAHRAFLQSWALPRFVAKRGEACDLILCNPADLADVGELPGVTVKADKTVLRRTFYLARVDSEEISA